MSLTVLKVVQDMLSDMDSDSVNSIGDTQEAYQVASALERVYNQSISDYDFMHIQTGYQLQGAGDPATPTQMSCPHSTQTILEVRYDTQLVGASAPSLATIDYLTPSQFVNIVSNLDTSATNTDAVVIPGGTTVGIRNDRAPKYWTSFDQETLVFDAYNNTVDTTLQASKSWVFGAVGDKLVLADSTVVTVPMELEDFILTQTAELCFGLWKGSTPRIVIDRARKSRVRMKRLKDRQRSQGDTGPDYGRKGPKPTKQGIEGVDSGTSRPLPAYMT
jgi:hypothetical protein